jgi:hypothetical protein
MLHSKGMKQRDLKNPSCRTLSKVRQEKSHWLFDSGGARGGQNKKKETTERIKIKF